MDKKLDIARVAEMIATLLPDAIPGDDFEIVLTADNHAEVLRWNERKLGVFPGLAKMREVFLSYAKKRKEKMPSFDDSDPLPYMAEPPEQARRMIRLDSLPVVDVTTLGGTTFIRKK
ncbi:MAG: hypothetical protein J6T08_08425 [Lentisphaeria bacterium]|nr:hypothetical protein [Lentisphaeria bacterium]